MLYNRQRIEGKNPVIDSGVPLKTVVKAFEKVYCMGVAMGTAAPVGAVPVTMVPPTSSSTPARGSAVDDRLFAKRICNPSAMTRLNPGRGWEKFPVRPAEYRPAYGAGPVNRFSANHSSGRGFTTRC